MSANMNSTTDFANQRPAGCFATQLGRHLESCGFYYGALYLFVLFWVADPYRNGMQLRLWVAKHWSLDAASTVLYAYSLGSILAILCVVLSRVRMIRVLGFLVLLLTLVFSGTHMAIAGHAPTATTFEIIKLSYSNASFFAAHFSIIAFQFVKVLIFLLPLFLLSKVARLIHVGFVVAPVMYFAVSVTSVMEMMGEDLYFPSFYTVPSLAAVSLFEDELYQGPLLAVSIHCAIDTRPAH